MFTFFTGSIPSWTLITFTNSKVFCVVAVQFSSLEPGQNDRKRVWAGKVMGSTWEGNKVVLPANLLVPWGGRSGPVTCANEQYPSRCWWRIYMCPTPCSAFPIRSHFILPMRGTAIILIFPKRNGTWALGHSQEDAELSHRGTESQTQQSHTAACVPACPADSNSHEWCSTRREGRGSSQKFIQPHSYHTTWRLIKAVHCFQLMSQHHRLQSVPKMISHLIW